MDRAWIIVVSGRAYDLKCSCTTLVYTVLRPILMIPETIDLIYYLDRTMLMLH